MGHETSMGGKDSRFQSTLWEVVLQAKNGEAQAVDQLARDYWKPVYFYIRRKGQSVESAKDLTQSFLGHLLEKDLLSRVDPEKGKFRSFIMATLGNFLNNERRTAQALKRGGAYNFVEAEDDLRSADATPEKALFRVRGRLQHLLRESVKAAVDREGDVDSELREIFASLG